METAVFLHIVCVGVGVRGGGGGGGGVKPMRNNLFIWFSIMDDVHNSEDSSLNWLPSFTYIRVSLRFYGTNIHPCDECDSNLFTPVRKVIPIYSPL